MTNALRPVMVVGKANRWRDGMKPYTMSQYLSTADLYADMMADIRAKERKLEMAEKLAEALRGMVETYREPDNGRYLRWAIDGADAVIAEWDAAQ